MKTRSLAALTLLVAALTTLWVVLVIILQASAGPVETLADRIAVIERQGALYTLNYLNAGLLTLATVAMLAGFAFYTWEEDRLWTLVALVFIPIYGALNAVVYFSQVFMVPGLIELYSNPETAALAETLLGLTVHEWPGSAVAFVNALAYAVLGVPSILLGWLMLRKQAQLRTGAVLLVASVVLSIAALVGVGVQNALLASMTLLSGFLYLVGLVLIGTYWLREPAEGVRPAGKRRKQPDRKRL